MRHPIEALETRRVPPAPRATPADLSWVLSRHDRRELAAHAAQQGRAMMARDDVPARVALLLAGALLAAAIFLPLWHVTVVAAQLGGPLRVVVYPTHLEGDVARLNAVNHSLGLREISEAELVELRLLPVLLGFSAFAAIAGAFVRRPLATALPLVLLMATAAYGATSMWVRLYRFGHDGGTHARHALPAFTPPIIGGARVAEFASRAAFAWGATVLALAAVLMALVLWRDRRAREEAARERVFPTARR